MITGQCLKWFGLLVKIASFNHNVPYKWLEGQLLLRKSSRKSKKWWVLWTSLSWIHAFFVVSRFVHVKMNVEVPVENLIIHVYWSSIVLGAYTINMVSWVYQQELIQLVNFLVSFERRYKVVAMNDLHGLSLDKKILKYFSIFAIINQLIMPVFTPIFYWIKPCGAHFIGSALMSCCGSSGSGHCDRLSNFWPMFGFYLIECLIFWHIANTGFFHTIVLAQALFCVETYLRLIRICPEVTVQTGPFMFRQVQIIGRRTNLIFRNLYLVVLEATGTLVIITSLFAIIQLHGVIGVAGSSGFFLFMLAIVVVIILSSRLAGKVIHASKALVNSWKRLKATPRDTKYIKAFRKSCPTISFFTSVFHIITMQRAFFLIRYSINRALYLMIYFDKR